MDNKLIEVYCARIENISETESRDLLEEKELFGFFQDLATELKYIIELPFVKFWAYVIKNTYVITFLDTYLQNMRKQNDIYKLQLTAEKFDTEVAGEGESAQVRRHADELL